MAEILPSASYVRNSTAPIEQQRGNDVLRSIGERIDMQSDLAAEVWNLLETPQTLDSLRRSVGAQADEEGERITALLAELYDRELIQLSPDT